MEPKFVIWGTGTRGKRAASFIGKHRVLAFIDSNPAMLGSKCYGKIIVSFEQYLSCYKDCILVISPVNPEEIVKTLEKKGVPAYLLFNDCPSEVNIGQIDSIREISLPQIDYSKAAVYGCSLYSLVFWDYLSEKGINIPIIFDTDQKELQSILVKNYKISFLGTENISHHPSILLQTVKTVPKIEGISTIDLYNMYPFVKKFFHPRLERFKNIHLGQRCFIIGNGQSLLTSDLDILFSHKEVCFGMNGIPLIFGNTVWRPFYYVIEDGKGMDQFGDLILRSEMKNIFISDTNPKFVEKVKFLNNFDVFHLLGGEYSPDFPAFSTNIVEGIVCGKTVTYACLQLAVYMGFREIYLLGVDFDYANGDTKIKHFSEQYHMKPDMVNPCARDDNLLAYQSAKRYADAHGIKIYNATRGGALEVFERVDFDSLFGK